MRRSLARTISLAIGGLAVSAVLGLFTVVRVSWSDGEIAFHPRLDAHALAVALRGTDPITAALFVALTWATLPLRAWQWGLFVAPRGRWGDRYHAIARGFLALQVLPARLGEFTRALVLAGRVPALGRLSAVGSVALSRVLDLVALWLICLPLPLVLDPVAAQARGLSSAFVVVTLAVVVSVGLLVLSLRWRPSNRSGRLSRALAPLVDSFVPIARGRTLARAIGATLLVQFLSAAAYVPVIHALAPSLPLVPAAVLALASASFGLALPSSPGGIGVYHFAVAWGLGTLGATPAEALAIALVTHAGCLVAFVGAGVLSLAMPGNSGGDKFHRWRSGGSHSSTSTVSLSPVTTNARPPEGA